MTYDNGHNTYFCIKNENAFDASTLAYFWDEFIDKVWNVYKINVRAKYDNDFNFIPLPILDKNKEHLKIVRVKLVEET